MTHVKDITLPDLSISSSVFPTAEDKAMWTGLSDDQRHAIILHDEQSGFESGIASNSDLQDLLTEVRSEKSNQRFLSE